MCWHVYVLKSLKDNSRYVGITSNIYRRLQEHNSGKSKYTKGHAPYKIVYQEKFLNRNLARDREKYFKSGHGRADLDKLIPL